mmetsp:Transcript_9672/g.14219  ORF Transcript_9672/g.14219 Transcript_9672/m.14219 type:complete len:205 (+) Transcript_9672:2506-3120(+)
MLKSLFKIFSHPSQCIYTLDSSSEHNLQKKSPFPYGSRENISGFSHEFGLFPIDTRCRFDAMTFFRSASTNASTCLVITYSSEGNMPRRVAKGSGSYGGFATSEDELFRRFFLFLPNASNLGLLTPSISVIRFRAICKRDVSGIASDCFMCFLFRRAHSRIDATSRLVPSDVTPLNIQSHATLIHNCSPKPRFSSKIIDLRNFA